jgi:hypothetical protein
MPLTQVKTSNLDTTNSLLFRNRIINGDMRIDQRNAGASSSVSSNTYTLDRYRSLASGGGVYSVQQSSVAPAGFTKSLLMTVTTTAASLSAGNYYSLRQSIEGLNISDLAWGTASAKNVTLSFWVRSSLTGTFGGAVNNDNDASYAFTYTISAANTWEQKTITITGATVGTWASDNSLGLNLELALGVGSTRSGTAGTWTYPAAVLISATGATNVMATSGATLYITGVQLEVGTAATAFERRPYGTELNLCQRYYHYLGGDTAYQSINTVVWYGTGDAVGFFRHPVEMRSTPSIAKTGTWSTLGGGGSAGNTISGDQLGPKTVQLGCTGGSSGTSGQASTLRVSNDLNFRLTFSAEL